MLADLLAPRRRNAVTVTTSGVLYPGGAGPPTVESAKRLSAVYASIDIRASSMSVLPAYVMDTASRERLNHPIIRLLSVRPNEGMSPAVRKYLLEASILSTGNAYDWIIRDPVSRRPVELIPVPGTLVTPWWDKDLHAWYDIAHPVTGEIMRLPAEDVCHYKGPTRDGLKGMSVLSYAASVVQSGLAAQDYNTKYYASGGQPSGVLEVDADLSGWALDAQGVRTKKTKKDVLREEWERVHSGPDNAHRIAILDHGLKYRAISVSPKDSQFVEQQALTVEDIARYFSVPLYKLQAGKQSYNSNEQNAIEYQQSLQPRVTQMEEEQTYKLLSLSDQAKGLEIRYNMMALLRADNAARASYYRNMREAGVYSVNDIMELEDRPSVRGGEERLASLNYVPLGDWADLSRKRNGGNANES